MAWLASVQLEISTGAEPALWSSMNALVGLAGAPAPIWNSLILTGLTTRTLVLAVSVCFLRSPSVHSAIAMMSPFQNVLPHVIRMVLSLIHISEPTRLLSISYAVFC